MPEGTTDEPTIRDGAITRASLHLDAIAVEPRDHSRRPGPCGQDRRQRCQDISRCRSTGGTGGTSRCRWFLMAPSGKKNHNGGRMGRSTALSTNFAQTSAFHPRFEARCGRIVDNVRSRAASAAMARTPPGRAAWPPGRASNEQREQADAGDAGERPTRRLPGSAASTGARRGRPPTGRTGRGTPAASGRCTSSRPGTGTRGRRAGR